MAHLYNGGSYQNYVCAWIAFAIGLFSLVCSVLTLVLIYKMNIRNGYLLLVTSLVLCQMLYDVGHMIEIDTSYSACLALRFLNTLGGLSVALWTNIISLIVLYVAVASKSVNIYKNYPYFFVIALAPALTLALVIVVGKGVIHETDEGSCVWGNNDLATNIYNLYYWGRLVSIVSNIGVVVFISLYLKFNLMKEEHAASIKKKTAAIYVLVNRLKYYPFVQAICRSGSAWNEWDDGRYGSFSSYIMASICAPATGFGYFIVFLIMQPHAFETFKSWFGLKTNRNKDEKDGTNGVVDSNIAPSSYYAGSSYYSNDDSTVASSVVANSHNVNNNVNSNYSNSSNSNNSGNINSSNNIRDTLDTLADYEDFDENTLENIINEENSKIANDQQQQHQNNENTNPIINEIELNSQLSGDGGGSSTIITTNSVNTIVV